MAIDGDTARGRCLSLKDLGAVSNAGVRVRVHAQRAGCGASSRSSPPAMGQADDRFGAQRGHRRRHRSWSVPIEEDPGGITARGPAYVFTRSGGGVERAAEADRERYGCLDDHFGFSVSVSMEHDPGRSTARLQQFLGANVSAQRTFSQAHCAGSWSEQQKIPYLRVTSPIRDSVARTLKLRQQCGRSRATRP